MTILEIEHSVRDFDTWKAAFDGDPIGREQGGVRRYRIGRPAADANYVVVELEFDDEPTAQAFLERLRELWSRVVEQGLIENPKARILDIVETASA